MATRRAAVRRCGSGGPKKRLAKGARTFGHGSNERQSPRSAICRPRIELERFTGRTAVLHAGQSRGPFRQKRGNPFATTLRFANSKKDRDELVYGYPRVSYQGSKCPCGKLPVIRDGEIRRNAEFAINPSGCRVASKTSSRAVQTPVRPRGPKLPGAALPYRLPALASRFFLGFKPSDDRFPDVAESLFTVPPLTDAAWKRNTLDGDHPVPVFGKLYPELNFRNSDHRSHLVSLSRAWETSQPSAFNV